MRKDYTPEEAEEIKHAIGEILVGIVLDQVKNQPPDPVEQEELAREQFQKKLIAFGLKKVEVQPMDEPEGGKFPAPCENEQERSPLLLAREYVKECRREHIRHEVEQAYISGYYEARHRYRAPPEPKIRRSHTRIRQPDSATEDVMRFRFEAEDTAIELAGPRWFILAMLK